MEIDENVKLWRKVGKNQCFEKNFQQFLTSKFPCIKSRKTRKSRKWQLTTDRRDAPEGGVIPPDPRRPGLFQPLSRLNPATLFKFYVAESVPSRGIIESSTSCSIVTILIGYQESSSWAARALPSRTRSRFAFFVMSDQPISTPKFRFAALRTRSYLGHC